MRRRKRRKRKCKDNELEEKDEQKTRTKRRTNYPLFKILYIGSAATDTTLNVIHASVLYLVLYFSGIQQQSFSYY